MSSLSELESKTKSQPFLSWNDAHYCRLRSQSNVYSLSKLVFDKEKIKFLAASIDGHLTSIKFDYDAKSQKQIPITKDDVLFDFDADLNTNSETIKGEIEVVSIDIVSDWDGNGTNILAVTYLKLCRYDEDKRPEAFMNIYKMLESDVKVPSCYTSEFLVQELSLDFIPFKLTHHRVPIDSHWENLLLLSGSDHKIHTYIPIMGHEGYEEVDTIKYFPELAKIEDSVTQIEIQQLDDNYRLTSFGTQNGLVGLYLVNAESKDILDSWTSEMDSPITSMHFFQHDVNAKCPDFLKMNDETNKSKEEQEETEDEKGEEEYNLLVTSALDPALVYEDVLANGLSKCRILPLSNSQDVVLSSCVMDVDFDGENEVLIGTYGKVLLVYKLIREKPPVYSSTPFHSPMPVPINSNTPILPDDEDKPDKKEWNGHDKQEKEKDVRRRHRTVAGTTSCVETDSPSHFDRQDKHRSDNTGLMDLANQQAQQLRMVRSTENLASPSVRSIQLETPDRLDTPDITIPHFAMTPGLDFPSYKLMWTRRFCNPLMGLACDDVMGDGMLDLVVLTLKGLHILQPDLNEIATFVINRLQQIVKKREKEKPEEMESKV